MRKTIVKSLMTLLATMTCLSSYAELTFPKEVEKLTYNGKAQALFTDGTADDGYTWVYSPYKSGTPIPYSSYENASINAINADVYNNYYILNAESGRATISGVTDGYTYVDLGLSDGTLWSTCNLGATSIEGIGLYYKWGETTGSTSDISDGTHKYEDENGKYTKYVYDKETETSDYDYLQPEDDAATVNWGKSWSMPTQSQFNALIAGCTWENVNDYNGTGVSGFLGTSKSNGNTIFFAREAKSEMNLWSSNFYAKCGPNAVCNTGEHWLFQADYISGKMNSSSNGFSRHFLCIVRPVTMKKGTPTSGKLTTTIAKQRVGVRWSQYISNYTFTYDGEPHMSKCEIYQYGFEKGDDVKIVTSLVDATESILPGTYTAKAVLEGDDAINYYIPENLITKEFHIAKLTAQYGKSVPSQKKNETYDGKSHTPFEWTETGFSNEATEGHWEYYLEEYTGETAPTEIFTENYEKFSTTVPEVTKAGEYKVYFIYVPDDKKIYKVNEWSRNRLSFTLDQKEVTLEWPKPNSDGKYKYEYEYSGSDPRPVAHLNGIVSGDRVSLQSNPNKSNIKVGVYNTQVALIGDGMSNYKFAEDVETTQIYSIVPKEITFTTHSYVEDDINMTSFVYNGTAQMPVLKEIKGKIGSDKVNVVFVGDAQTNVGYDYSVTAKLTGDDSENYKLATDVVPFRITRKRLSVEWGNTTLIYSSTAGARIPEYKLDGVIDGDEVNIIESGQESKVGGPYTATLKLSKTANYKFYEDISTEVDLYNITTKEFYIKEPTTQLNLTLSRENFEQGFPVTSVKLDGNTCKADVTYTYYTDSEFTKKTTVKDNGADVAGGSPTLGDSENGGKTYYIKAVVAETDKCEGGVATTSFRITNTFGNEVKVPGTKDELPYIGEEQPLYVSKGSSTIDGTFVYVKQKPGTDAPKPSEYTTSIPKAKDVAKWIVKYIFTPDDTKKYSVLSGASFVDIVPAELTITWPETELIYEEGVAQAPKPVISGAKGTDKITYTVTGKETEVGDDYVATIVLDDEYKNNYTIKSGKTTPFTIVPATSALTLSLSIEGWTYGEEPNTPVLTGNECKGKETFAYYTDESCTKLTSTTDGAATNGGVPTYAGTYYVKATVAASGTCKAGSVTKSFKIAKKKPTIFKQTPTQLQDIKYNGAKQDLIIAGEAGEVNGVFKYAYMPTSTTTLKDEDYVEDVIPTGKNAGTYYSKSMFIPEDTRNYEIVIFSHVSKIIPASLTVTWPETKLTYKEGVEQAPEPVISGAKGTDKITYTVSGKEIEVGDTYVATLVLDDAFASNYTIASGKTTAFRIVSPSHSVTLSVLMSGWTYGSASSSPKVDGNECESKVTYTYYTDEALKVKTTTDNGASAEGLKPTKAGKYYVKAEVAASGNCEAGTASNSFVIEKKTINIEWGSGELVYNGGDQCPTYAFEVGSIVTNDVVKINVVGEATEVGDEYEASASLSGKDAPNYTISSNTATKPYIIRKVTASDYKEPVGKTSLKYIGEPIVLVEDGINGEIAGKFKYTIGKEVEFSDKIPTGTDAGDYVIGYQFVPNNFNYAPSEPKYITVTIAPVERPLEWGNTKLVYNGMAQAPTAKLLNLIGDDVVTVVVTGKETNVGTGYIATAALSPKEVDAKNYVISSESSTTTEFSISKSDKVDFTAPTPVKGLKYICSDLELIVPGKEGTIKGSFEYALGEDGEFLSSIPTVVNPDTYKVGYRFIPTDEGYITPKPVYFDVIVAKRELSLEWDKTELTYNGNAQKPEAALKGVIGNDDVTVKVTGEQTKVGKNYEAIATLVGKDVDKYTISSAKLTTEFSISSNIVDKPVLSQLEREYSGETVTFVKESENYTISGFNKALEPGSYQIKIVLNPGCVWVDGTNDPIMETFVIKKKSVEIPSRDTKPFVFNGKTQTYELKTNPAYTISGNEQRAAGSHDVTVSLKDKAHYEWSDKTISDKYYTFIISTGVIKAPKVDSVLEYVYDGIEKEFNITVAAGSILADSNSVGTDVGEYIRTVKLDMDEEGGYVWHDNTTEPKIFKFVIKPQPVIIPKDIDNYFIFDGKIHEFKVPEDTAAVKRYTISMETESSVGPGEFIATLSLKDKKNYVWADNSVDDIEIPFTITEGSIPLPEIKTVYPYTGEEITFAKSTSAYTVEGGSGKDAGSYTVVFTPTDNYSWLDGSKKSKSITVKIIEKAIKKPVLNTEPITYNGEELFRVPESVYYDITGDTFGVEPRKYRATLSLKKNYMWQDSTTADIEYKFEITKIIIPIPVSDQTEFIYTGEPQTYKIDVDPVCKVEGNVQTSAGLYSVKVSILSKYHQWSDFTEAPKSYRFFISSYEVDEPVVPKKSFVYDGTEQKFEIVENDDYVIDPANATATDAGEYIRYVSLIDTENYIWWDGTTEKKPFTFEIARKQVSVPNVETPQKFSGLPITFVEKSDAYSITNGVQTNAGEYEIVLSLNPNYVWKDGSTEDKTIPVEITSMEVQKPDVTEKTFEYDGNSHSFGFEANDGYSFVGDTAATEPGVYDVYVKLNNNYVWNDDTKDELKFTFKISKIDVSIPAANTSKFTYNGKEQTYNLLIPEDSLFVVKDNVQTKAGTYVVKACLKDSLHYQWSDSTTNDRPYDFVINKGKVPLPTAPIANLIYNGEEKQLKVNLSDLYVVADSNSVATKTGTYIRTATLTDPINYTWVDDSTGYKKIVFTIGDGSLKRPVIKTEYVYTGDTITFIPEDGSYSVLNGAKREVGKYRVVIIPNDGYRWEGETGIYDPIVYNVEIKPIMVDKPVLQLEYTYNSKVIDFKVPVNAAYEISGETSAKELGKYKVTLGLLPNYMWSDSTLEAVSYVFSINKKVIPIPEIDTTEFVYNGKRQTYTIAKSSDYNVLGAVQSYAGTYEVSVLLTDFTHSIWADSTTEVKTYMFNIARAKVELPTAVQESFSYDGTVKYFAVTENSRYEVLAKNASASNVGVYDRTVTLKDTLNYTWIDGSVTDKIVTFTIGNGTVDYPVVVLDTIYTGSPIIFVPENNGYTVENGTQTEAGTYTVVVKLKEGYLWSDKKSKDTSYVVTIRPIVVTKPLFPTTNTYTYNDSIYGVDIDESVAYMITGTTHAKEPGKYTVTVELKPNYIWNDNTTDILTYTYKINRIIVEIPAKCDSVFRFTGSEVTYPIPDTLDYYVVSGHHRVSAGLHHVTVTLTDTVHYEWADATTSPKIYEFLIDKYKVLLPIAVQDSFTYDGKVKLFEVEGNDNYVVERNNASAIDTGIYYVNVSLSDTINFLWEDGTVADKKVVFYILNGVIPSITIPTNLVYTGDSISLLDDNNLAYTVTRNKVKNAGTYEVIVTPNPGFTWASDGSKTGKRFTVIVSPKVVDIPKSNFSTFLYNGKEQVYNIIIPQDSLFTVTGNVQSEVGEYDVIVSLKDSLNYIWSDSTHSDKKYSFVIANSEFFVDPIVQSKDLLKESTPGHMAVFDVTVLGRVYKYWITCDSFPDLNVDTTEIKTASLTALDVFLPDTMKPGFYKIKINLMSGSLVKTQEVELKVNYPASDIYVVWNDVLTIDNSHELFKTYQWYKNGTPIEGATRQYYQDNTGLDGYYMCKVNDELFVGPLFFHSEKPLWIKAYGGKGTINVEVVGNIPTGTKVGVYSISGYEVEIKDAEKNVTFEAVPNSYIVKLIGPDPSVKFSSQAVKVLVK